MTILDRCTHCHCDHRHTPDSTHPVAWCGRCTAGCPTETAPPPGEPLELGDPDFGHPAPAYTSWPWTLTRPAA